MRIIHLSRPGNELLDAGGRLLDAARDERDDCHQRWREAESALWRLHADRPLWRELLSWAGPDEREARRHRDQVRAELTAAEQRLADLGHRLGEIPEPARATRDVLRWLEPLPDDWVALTGYRNQGGAPDVLLVGPGGIWSLVADNTRAWLYVDGPDDWRVERPDPRGNVKRGGPASDAGGRSWGRLAADPAETLTAQLDAELGGRLGRRPVRSAVVLVHAGAEVIRCRRPGVDLVAGRRGPLLDALTGSADTLDAEQRAEVEAVVGRAPETPIHQPSEEPARPAVARSVVDGPLGLFGLGGAT